jgi:hypothetical protein
LKELFCRKGVYRQVAVKRGVTLYLGGRGKDKEEDMKRSAAVFYAVAAAGLSAAVTGTGCSGTISGCSVNTVETGTYYSAAGTEKERSAYFDRVRGHFQQIGRSLKEDEVRQYTASISIITIPACAEVYIGSVFMGKANTGPLYFTPGRHELVFMKSGRQSRKTFDLVEGKNLSIVVKLQT